MSFRLALGKRKEYDTAQYLLKTLQKPSFDPKSLTNAFDDLCKQKFLVPFGREDLDQEIFKQFYMAIHNHYFEINDYSTILYWLTEARYLLSIAEYNKFEDRVKLHHKSMTLESINKLFNVYSTINRHKRDIISILVDRFLDHKPEAPDMIEAGFNLCALSYYNKNFWSFLREDTSKVTPSLHQKIRVIQYAISTESASLANRRLISGVSIDEYLSNALKVDLPVDKMSNVLVKESDFHKEVKYILSQIKNFNEYVNCDNAFLCDFGNPELKILIDVDGPAHYLRSTRNKIKHMIGQVGMKNRLLTQNKWNLVSIPYFEWNKFLDETEKVIYVRRKLKKQSII